MALKEYDLDFESTTIHCWEGGTGFPVVLLHGSGPGASTIGNWKNVMEPMAESYHVVLTDMIGFGLSGKKTEEPYFDIDLWTRQGQFLVDRFPDGPVGIVAHSLATVFAFRLAHANERVTKLLITGSVGRPVKLNPTGRGVWSYPETREQLREVMELIIFNHEHITDEFLDNRMAILQTPGFREYHEKMFAGDRQALLDQTVFKEEDLAKLTCDITFLHGREDNATGFEAQAVELTKLIPQADLYGVARCGHGPALEYPEKFMSVAKLLFG